ncbi:MAG: DUF4465 domain-containing protein [Burkholderiales bacterium]|nr:DUF4465 domain-containing protein [Bacteroidia bacterium]
MKKTITKLALALSFIAGTSVIGQTVSFDTFTLSPNSYYKDTTNADFSNSGVTFRYAWNTSFGGYWESGSAYTNVNDTINVYPNIYGAITGTAFAGNNYATVQSGAIITFSNNTTAVSGFYITNSTFAWKSVKKGDQFSRRFGDTTGTGSGASIAQGQYPDWFKLSVIGFRNGSVLTDTIHFYLADYRAAGTANDYVIKNWQFLNCSTLGQVDSISFDMKSSDNSFGFMNTPAFFSMDNFTIQSTVGIEELSADLNISLFPNPASQNIILNYESKSSKQIMMTIYDITGKELQTNQFTSSIGTNQQKISVETLEAGIYFLEMKDQQSSKKIKFIKL